MASQISLMEIYEFFQKKNYVILFVGLLSKYKTLLYNDCLNLQSDPCIPVLTINNQKLFDADLRIILHMNTTHTNIYTIYL